MSHKSIVRVAHRGAAAQFPENRLLAFRQENVTSFSSKALHIKAIHPEVSTMLDPSPQDGSLTPREICAQTLNKVLHEVTI